MVFNFRGRPRTRPGFRGNPRGRGRGRGGFENNRGSGLLITLNTNKWKGQNQGSSWVTKETTEEKATPEITNRQSSTDNKRDDRSPSRGSNDKFDVDKESESLRITVGNERIHDRRKDESRRSPIKERSGSPGDKQKSVNYNKDRGRGRGRGKSNYTRERHRSDDSDHSSLDNRFRQREDDRGPGRSDYRDDRRGEHRSDEYRKGDRDSYNRRDDRRDDRRDRDRDSFRVDGRRDEMDRSWGDDDRKEGRRDSREEERYDRNKRSDSYDDHSRRDVNIGRFEQETRDYEINDRNIENFIRMQRTMSPVRPMVEAVNKSLMSHFDRQYSMPEERHEPPAASTFQPKPILKSILKRKPEESPPPPFASGGPEGVQTKSYESQVEDFLKKLQMPVSRTPASSALINMAYADPVKPVSAPAGPPMSSVPPMMSAVQQMSTLLPNLRTDFPPVHSEMINPISNLSGLDSFQRGPGPSKLASFGNSVMDVDDEEDFLYGEGEARPRDFQTQESLFPVMKKPSLSKPAPEIRHPDFGPPKTQPASSLPSWMNPIPEPAEEEPKPDDNMDQTIQNVLKSIGFNFDLSKRMQELAKDKKKKEQANQIAINQNASFLGGGLSISEKLFQKEKRTEIKERIMQSAKVHAMKDFHEEMPFMPKVKSTREQSHDSYQSREHSHQSREHSHEFRDDGRERSYDSRERSLDKRDSNRDSRDISRDQRRDVRDQRPDSRDQRRDWLPDESMDRRNKRSSPSRDIYNRTESSPSRTHTRSPTRDIYERTAPTRSPNRDSYSRPASNVPHMYPPQSQSSFPDNRGGMKSHNYPGMPSEGVPPNGGRRDSPFDSSGLHWNQPLPPGSSNISIVPTLERETEERKPTSLKREREKSPEYSRIVLAPKSKKLENEAKIKKLSDDVRGRWSPVKENIKISVTSDRKEVYMSSGDSDREELWLMYQKEKEAAKAVKLELQKLHDAKSSAIAPTAAERVVMKKQSEECRKKLELLEKELGKLKKHQNEIMRRRRRQTDGHKDPVLIQNSKLQEEITAQIRVLRKATHESEIALELGVRGDAEESDEVVPVEKPVVKKEEVKATSGKEKRHEFYDPGSHWCNVCNLVSVSLFEHLSHLQSKRHKQKLNPFDRPWLDVALKEDAAVDKKLPVTVASMKGVEFLMSTDAFYCSLCNSFAGDVTCAETHLKSETHFDNYQEHLKGNEFYEKRYTLEKTAFLSQKREEEEEQERKEHEDRKRKAEEEERKRKCDEIEETKRKLLEERKRRAEEKANKRQSDRYSDEFDSDNEQPSRKRYKEKGRESRKEQDREERDKNERGKRDRKKYDGGDKRSRKRESDDDRRSQSRKEFTSDSEDDSRENDDKGKIAIKLNKKAIPVKPQSKSLPPWTPLTKGDGKKKITKQDIDQPSSLGKFLSIGGLTTKKLPVYKLRPGTVKKPVEKPKPAAVVTVADEEDYSVMNLETMGQKKKFQPPEPAGPPPPLLAAIKAAKTKAALLAAAPRPPLPPSVQPPPPGVQAPPPPPLKVRPPPPPPSGKPPPPPPSGMTSHPLLPDVTKPPPPLPGVKKPPLPGVKKPPLPGVKKPPPPPLAVKKPPEPSTTKKSPEPSTAEKIPEPSTAKKAPEPSTAEKIPEPSTSNKAPEPSTAEKTPAPSATKKPPGPSAVTLPAPSAKNEASEPSKAKKPLAPSESESPSIPTVVQIPIPYGPEKLPLSPSEPQAEGEESEKEIFLTIPLPSGGASCDSSDDENMQIVSRASSTSSGSPLKGPSSVTDSSDDDNDTVKRVISRASSTSSGSPLKGPASSSDEDDNSTLGVPDTDVSHVDADAQGGDIVQGDNVCKTGVVTDDDVVNDAQVMETQSGSGDSSSVAGNDKTDRGTEKQDEDDILAKDGSAESDGNITEEIDLGVSDDDVDKEINVPIGGTDVDNDINATVEDVDQEVNVPIGAAVECVDKEVTAPIGNTSEDVDNDINVPVGNTSSNIDKEISVPVVDTGDNVDMDVIAPVSLETDEKLTASEQEVGSESLFEQVAKSKGVDEICIMPVVGQEQDDSNSGGTEIYEFTDDGDIKEVKEDVSEILSNSECGDTKSSSSNKEFPEPEGDTMDPNNGNLDVVLATIFQDSIDKSTDIAAFDMSLPTTGLDIADNSVSAMSEMDDLSGNISFMMGEIAGLEGDENANAASDCNVGFSTGQSALCPTNEDFTSGGSDVCISDFQVLDELLEDD